MSGNREAPVEISDSEHKVGFRPLTPQFLRGGGRAYFDIRQRN